MDNRAIRHPENFNEILEQNRKIIYHIPAKYKNLRTILATEGKYKPLRETLLKMYSFFMNIEPIIYKQKYVYYMDNGRLTSKVRGKTTSAVSNHHFNYLCCVGLLTKLKQTEDNRIGINDEFRIENPDKRHNINVFTIYRYTEKRLAKMDEQAGILLAHKVTAGNISCDRLRAVGLNDLAEQIYMNDIKSFDRKERFKNKVFKAIDDEIESKGYTTKVDLCLILGVSRWQIDKLFSTYKLQISERYRYKAPSMKDCEKYNLKTDYWILTREE